MSYSLFSLSSLASADSSSSSTGSGTVSCATGSAAGTSSPLLRAQTASPICVGISYLNLQQELCSTHTPQPIHAAPVPEAAVVNLSPNRTLSERPNQSSFVWYHVNELRELELAVAIGIISLDHVPHFAEHALLPCSLEELGEYFNQFLWLCAPLQSDSTSAMESRTNGA